MRAGSVGLLVRSTAAAVLSSLLLGVTIAAAGPKEFRLELGGGREAKLVLARSSLGEPLLDADTPIAVRATIEQSCELCLRVAETSDRWTWLPAAVRWSKESSLWIDPIVSIEVDEEGWVSAEEIWIYRTPVVGIGDRVWSLAPPAYIPTGWRANAEHEDLAAVSLLVAIPRRIRLDEIRSFSLQLR